ncbi:MAG: VOC family protein [Pseudomonadota bacterium]|nr:VOC family protein [Pseudomonadota bacterium]
MKRLHVHISVDNLADSMNFYSALFGAQPVRTKPDYAKWMLDDPRVNFAISTRAGKKGVDHLGIQVDDASELAALRDQLSEADLTTHSEGEAVCCYARSEKSWVTDPNGIPWEAYHTMENAQVFFSKEDKSKGVCCAPETGAVSSCSIRQGG